MNHMRNNCLELIIFMFESTVHAKNFSNWTSTQPKTMQRVHCSSKFCYSDIRHVIYLILFWVSK